MDVQAVARGDVPSSLFCKLRLLKTYAVPILETVMLEDFVWLMLRSSIFPNFQTWSAMVILLLKPLMQFCKARVLSGIHKISLVKGTKLQDMLLYAYCGSCNEARGCRRDDTFLGMIDETKALAATPIFRSLFLGYLVNTTASICLCFSICFWACGGKRILSLGGKHMHSEVGLAGGERKVI